MTNNLQCKTCPRRGCLSLASGSTQSKWSSPSKRQLNTSLQAAKLKDPSSARGLPSGVFHVFFMLQTLLPNISRPLSTWDPEGVPRWPKWCLKALTFLLGFLFSLFCSLFRVELDVQFWTGHWFPGFSWTQWLFWYEPTDWYDQRCEPTEAEVNTVLFSLA